MSSIATATTTIPIGTWVVDPKHSSVTFAARHMGIATIRGQFRSYEGRIEITGDADRDRASGSVDVASLDTNQGTRDEHLRSPDFFDVERFPRATFTATAFRTIDGARFQVVGQLTLRDVTRELTLDGVVHGSGIDPREGEERLALQLVGEIDRRDFDMRFNRPMGNGGVLISNTVELRVDISAIKA